MKIMFLLVRIIGEVIKVVVMRPFSGPTLPSWTLKTEIMVRAFNHAMAFSLDNLDTFRNLQEKTAPKSKLAHRVSCKKESANGVEIEWFAPDKQVNEQNVLIYLHGGAYIIGSVNGFRPFLTQLAVDNSVKVVGVDYRLGPEHAFPAAQDDAMTVFSWLLEQGYSADRIGVAGDSAGGGLTASLLLQARESDKPLPAYAMLFSPWVHPLARGGTMIANRHTDILNRDWLVACAELYMQGESLDHPWVAPLLADLSGMPPMLIQVGDAEVFFDQVNEYADKVTAAGGTVTLDVYPDMMHDFQILIPDLPESERAMASISQFVAPHLS